MPKEKSNKSYLSATQGINVYAILNKYYDPNSKLYRILVQHSEAVAKKALSIAKGRKSWKLDKDFLYEGAMLHDIGIYQCYAPGIDCFGDEPYIRHGVIGAEILRSEGLPRHALVCERHTGVGLTLENILIRDLPLPHREMVPITLEEQIICFADCFFSKSGDPSKVKSVEQILRGLAKHGEDQVLKFETWCRLFLD